MTENRPLGYWLKLVDTLIDRQFEALVEEHGVTRRQWQILNVLSGAPATEADLNAALASFLDTGTARAGAGDGVETVAEHLEELIGSGWVVDQDGRFALSGLGRSSLATLGEVVERSRQRTVEGVTAEEYEATLDVLERMSRNLGWNG